MGLTSPGPYVTLTLTSPGPRVTLVLTSPGPHVTPMPTSPGPHVILIWQEETELREALLCHAGKGKHGCRRRPNHGLGQSVAVRLL